MTRKGEFSTGDFDGVLEGCFRFRSTSKVWSNERMLSRMRTSAYVLDGPNKDSTRLLQTDQRLAEFRREERGVDNARRDESV